MDVTEAVTGATGTEAVTGAVTAAAASDSGVGDSEARRTLHRVFGYESFRGEQGAIIEHVVAGGDAVVLMPTGGGKSSATRSPPWSAPAPASSSPR